jgi:hypothetical protein
MLSDALTRGKGRQRLRRLAVAFVTFSSAAAAASEPRRCTASK